MRKTKIKKSPFNINNIYAEGLRLRQSVPTAQARFYDVMSEPANTGMFNTVSSDYAPDLTYQENSGLYPNIDENGEITTVTEDDFKKAKKEESGFFDEGGTVDELYTELTHPLSVWRQGWKRKYESQKSHEETALKHAVLGLRDLDTADKYISEFEDYANLIKQRDQLINSNADQNTINQIEQKISQKLNSIKELDDYIKQNWKSSDQFLKLFTNIDDMTVDKSLEYATRGDQYESDRSGTFMGGVKNVANFIGSQISRLPNTVQNTVLRMGDKDAYKAQIMKNSYNDELDKSRYFDSVTKHLNDADLFIKNIKSKIKEYKQYQQRIFDEKSADLIRTNNIVKNGNWLFDPNKIDKHYQELQEGESNNGLLNILNPIKWGYMLPEIGSSFADMQTFFALMGVEKFAALAGGTADFLNPLGGAKAKIAKYALKATALAGAAGSMYLASQSRKVETESEVADAYLQRITNSLYDNKSGIDVNKVFKSIDDFADTLPGLDKNAVKKMNVEDKLRLALAYNINTGDKRFEELKQKFRPGLAKIYNENNSLSVMDYLQMMPYMTYTGKVIKKHLGDKITNGVESMIGRKLPNIAEKASNAARALSDRAINAVFSENAQSIYKKVLASHSATWLAKQAKALAHVGFFEGVEEGQQQLLQSRYQRGEYDDYRKPESMFDVPSAINDVELGVNAVFDYLGLRPSDPDNLDADLIKSMNIGAGTGGIFHGIHVINPVSNALNGKYDEYTLRGFAGQLKNDYMLKNIVGEHYGRAEDDAHIKLFYNMMQKGGFKVDPVRINRSFQEMKRFKGELVDDEFIDKDIDLFNTTYFVYKNKELYNTLKELGISENTDDELKVVQNAVRAISDDNTLSKLIEKQKKNINANQQEIRDVLDWYLENKETSTEDAPKEIKDKAIIYRDLIANLTEGYNSYKEAVAKRNDKKELETKAKKEINYDKKREENKDNKDALDKLDKELKDKITDLTEETISEKDYISNRINLIFNIRKIEQLKKTRKLFNDRLQLNKYINQELGLDLNLDRLSSLTKNIDEQIKAEEKYFNSLSKEDNAKIDIYNKYVDEENKNRTEQNKKNKKTKGYVPLPLLSKRKYLIDQFKEQVYDKLKENIFTEYDRNIKNQSINIALRNIYNPYVMLYRSGGHTDPRDVVKQVTHVKWSDLSEEQRNNYREYYRDKYGKDISDRSIAARYQQDQYAKKKKLYDLIEDYKKAEKEYNDKAEEDRTVSDDIKMQKKAEEITKEAGKFLIQYDLKEKRERQHIAHQQFLKEGGITTDDVERAENGDTKARREIESSEESTETNPSEETEETPATESTESTVPGGEPSVEGTDNSDLYSGETSTEDLIDETVGRNRGKKKPEDEKKSTETRSTIEPSEKPGVAAVERKLDEQDSKKKNSGEVSPGVADILSHQVDDTTGGFVVEDEKKQPPVPQQPTEEGTQEQTDTKKEGQQIYDSVKNGTFGFADLQSAPLAEYDIDDHTRVKIDEKYGVKYIEIVDPTKAETSYTIPVPWGYDSEGITNVTRLQIDNGNFEVTSNDGVHILQKEGPKIDPARDIHNPSNTTDSSSEKTEEGKRGVSSTEEIDHDIKEEDTSKKEDESEKTKPQVYNCSEEFFRNIWYGRYTIEDLKQIKPGIYRYEKAKNFEIVVNTHEGENDDIVVEIYVNQYVDQSETPFTIEHVKSLCIPISYGTDVDTLQVNRIFLNTKGELWFEHEGEQYMFKSSDDVIAIYSFVQECKNGSIDVADLMCLPNGTYSTQDLGIIRIQQQDKCRLYSIILPETGARPLPDIKGYELLQNAKYIKIYDDGKIEVSDDNKTFRELYRVNSSLEHTEQKDRQQPKSSQQQYDEVKDQPQMSEQRSNFEKKVDEQSDEIIENILDFESGLMASDQFGQPIIMEWSPNIDGVVTADYNATHVDYISQTLFYLNSRYDRNGKENGPIILTVDTQDLQIDIDGKTINIKDKIQPGWKLAQKLLDHNWLRSNDVKKFYVVSGNAEAVQYNINSYTVSMCLQDTKDDNKIYVVTFKTPALNTYVDKNGNTRLNDGREKLLNQLLMVGVDKAKYAKYIDDLKRDGKYIPGNTEESARKYAHNGRSHFFTKEEIEENINKLIENRKAIIEAYCTQDENGHCIIPKKARTDVVPKEVRQSCGQLNSERDSEKMPVFKPLTDERIGLGISKDPVELQKQLEDGSVQLGYGTGEYSEHPYSIIPLYGDYSYQARRGYAGKIYLMEEVEGTKFPITLREQRFDQITTENGLEKITQDNLELRIDPETGNLRDGVSSPPSAAEVLLYLLTGMINTNALPHGDRDTIEPLLNLFLFNGEKTTMTSKRVGLNRKKWYADKWINVDEKSHILSIVIKDKNTGERRTVYYNMDQIKNDEATRKNIVWYISKNMHWNTDKDVLSNKLDNVLLNALSEEFSDDKNSFSLFGLEQFTFRKQDFFNEDGTQKNVSVLSWIITNGKLMTDISPQMFKDPFVFANGVNNGNVIDQSLKSQPKSKKSDSQKQRKTNTKKPKQKETPQTLNPVETPQSHTEQSFERWNETKAKNIKKINWLPDAYYDESSFPITIGVNKKTVVERLFIDMSPLQIMKQDALKNNKTIKIDPREFLQTKVKEFAKKAGIQIVEFDFKGGFTNQPLENLCTSYVTVVNIFENGVAQVTAYNKETLNAKKATFKVSGIYSSEKGKGKFNKEKALKWLQDKLGLTEEKDVFTTKSLLKMMDGKEVYGVVEPSAHTIGAIMQLSEQGGKGLEYHEAWHWVNMLLHTREQRVKMYNAYCEAHPKAKTLKYRELEELLAEDFRSYALYKNNLFSIHTLKRAYKNIANFVSAVIHFNWEIRTAYNTLRSEYNSINNGEYRNNTIDERSFNAFKARYKYINSEFYIPTVSEKAVKGFKYISTYDQFYRVCESLANKLLDYCAISRIEDFGKANGTSFNELIEELRDTCEDDEMIEGVISDIYNNKKMFFNIVKNIFAQYGIKAKLKKLKQLKKDEDSEQNTSDEVDEVKTQQEDETSAKVDIGEAPDNPWDRFQFESSKKDNVASRAKLFLTHLRKGHLIPNEDGSKTLIYEQDDLLQSPIYMPFGEVWNRILEDLWSVETYDDRDNNGQYLPNSLRGMIARKKENDAFYRILDEKLSELDGNTELGIKPDIQLQNEILNTIKSQKPQMAAMWLEDPSNTFTNSMNFGDMIGGDFDYFARDATDEDIDDVSRIWKIQNDNSLRAQFALPKQWSNTLALSGLIESGSKSTIVSKTFVNNVSEKYNLLKTRLNELKNTEVTNEIVDDLINDLVGLLNYMSIPVDSVVIEHYIGNKIASRRVGDAKARFQEIHNIVTNIKDKSSVSNLVKMFENSKGHSELKIDNRHSKQLLDAYNKYKEDSFIRNLAKAYHETYPSSSEFSIKGPDGSMHYPISQNNHMSDQIRELNQDKEAIKLKQLCKYAANSLILKNALNINESDAKNYFVLNAFIGIKDTRKNKGKDYFGISFLEDYIAKMNMTFNNMLTLPTMADKKTWYSIACKLLTLPHDLITYDIDSKNGTYLKQRFSKKTLDIFVGYFSDEMESLIQYYDRSNIEYLKNNPNKLRKNYHGKFKNGRMDFSGNGGLFRYMYDIEIKNGMNLNEYLESQYEIQKKLEADGGKYGGIESLREHDDKGNQLEFDGFELVRKALYDLKTKYKNKDLLRDNLNQWLFNGVEDEIENMSSGPYRIGFKDKDGRFIADAIPTQILKYYADEFNKAMGVETKEENPYSNAQMLHNYSLSAIANHKIATMISIIELEKVFAGDPAFYKYNYKKDGRKVTINQKINGKQRQFTVNVKQLDQKDADKIKRLGALLSPGANIRTQYNNNVTNNEEFKHLKGDKYTVLNVNDFKAKSLYLDEMKSNFKRQYVIEYLRDAVKNNKTPEWFQNFLENNKKEYTSVEKFFLALYHKQGLFGEFENIANEKEYKKYKDEINLLFDTIEKAVEISVGPYEDITVSDAQVIIRPELYRKIRMGLGEWSTEEDSTGYSDEKAYQILEKDGSWMHDEEKAKIVSKLELYPLKMSYFQNSPEQIGGIYINLPIYNKMAIFPMFKYMTQSSTGKALYNRMNNSEKGCIDMLAFDSAVKVGDVQNKYSTYDKNDTNLEHFNYDGLRLPSDRRLDENNNICGDVKGESLAIQIQSLKGLRMQLNTEAHKDMERKIGSQMFKIAFSNVIDDLLYGSNRQDVKGRVGRDIKHDIMFCINALTNIGEKNIQEEFGISKKSIDKDKVKNFIKRVIENNNLGIPSQEIFDTTGCAASLTSRRVFEQSAASLINREVVAIETNGGTAVQQSMFGLIGFDKNNIKGDNGYTTDGYRLLNGGKELKWSTKNNTIEVMLSINQFRSVLPKSLRNATFEVRRQWLIDHDIIKGVKSKEYWQVSEKNKHDYNNLQLNVVDLNLSVRLLNILQKHNINTVKDVIDNIKNYEEYLGEKEHQEVNDLLDSLQLSFDTNTNIQGEKTYSKPKIMGIGYRIPTQGLSSMFAFTCADVIPEQSGDLIIVPREFTAQTGSDFDVDKLYISVLSYEDGQYCDFSKEDYDKIQEIYKDKQKKYKQSELTNAFSEIKYKKALQNRLLQNYIDIITDQASYAAMRSSIDTYTGKIKHELLPLLRDENEGYRKAGYELSPYFQLRRKMEFTIGKSGIGPFALNITNMALTQFAHLTLNYKKSNKILQDFDLGSLDAVTSRDKDKSRISDWLSAMVNAHVDVAKDPYIFDMNINSSTYMFVNFLLRAGKGMSTFTFIAQPAIKELATLMQESNSMYGENIKSRQNSNKKRVSAYETVMSKYQEVLVKYLKDNEEFLDKNNPELKAKLLLLTQGKKADKEQLGDVKRIKYTSIFDEDYSKKILLKWKNRNKEPLDIGFYMYQVMCLQAWSNIEPYAKELSALVTASRIDTEKFGNNIPAQLNFINDYNSFMKGHRNVSWIINNPNENYTEKLKEDGNYALKRYFNNTFLNSKLYKATGLVKTILRNQLFTATGPFESIFRTFMCNVVGSVKLSDGTLAWDKVYDENFITSMAQAIDNTMRYQAVCNIEQKPNKMEEDKLLGPIDFTCNNNPLEVYNKLQALMFGNEEYANTRGNVYKMDIFKRTSNLLSILNNFNQQKQEVKDRFENLVDINGNLKNEFLKFLRPQTASWRFPIGRFLLAKNAFSVTKQEESILVSAFNELLRSKDDNIRRLARDLVFYGYYAHYDNNSPQSFFNLVPPYFRKQYDTSLRAALNRNNSDLLSILSPKEGQISDYFIDVISRNYWYDDNIVPVKYASYSRDITNDNPLIKLVNVQHQYNSLFDGKHHVSNVYGIVITSKFGGKPYIKLQYGKDHYLYKKVGIINKPGVDDKGRPVIKSMDIYIVVPKLGIYENGIHQVELNGLATGKSLFKTNQLPNGLKFDTLLQALDNWIKDTNEKYKDKFQLEYKPNEINLQQFNDYMPATDDEYFQRNRFNRLRFKNVGERKDVKSELSNNVNGVIDLSNNGTDIHDQVQKIYDSINSEYKNMVLGITGNYVKQVSQKAIDDRIQELVNEYEVMLNQKEPNADHTEELNKYRKSLNVDLIKDDLIKAEIYDYVKKKMDEITKDFNIVSLKIDGNSNIGRAVAAYRENNDNFRYSSGDNSIETCIVLVKKSMVKTNADLSTFLDQLSYKEGDTIANSQPNPEQKAQLDATIEALTNFEGIESGLSDGTSLETLSSETQTKDDENGTSTGTKTDTDNTDSLAKFFLHADSNDILGLGGGLITDDVQYNTENGKETNKDC